jgi:rubredoxin
MAMTPTIPTKCPGCGASWQGEPIPEASRKNNNGVTHFRRSIAIYNREEDRTVGWGCPDCGLIFDRDTLRPTGVSLPR